MTDKPNLPPGIFAVGGIVKARANTDAYRDGCRHGIVTAIGDSEITVTFKVRGLGLLPEIDVIKRFPLDRASQCIWRLRKWP
jgi:hypothetical protein